MRSPFKAFFWIAVFCSCLSAFEPHNPSENASRCCMKFNNTQSEMVFFPGEDLYEHAHDLYWGQQQWLNSTCIITPESTDDVQHLVEELKTRNCPFAIRSGGHGLVLEENSVRIGVTINLGCLNQTVLSADKSFASIGPGAKWRDVYRALSGLGYAVPGGRSGQTGVGGLITGGGNSFFAAAKGFVCDNVRNYQVVLGNGSIVDANNKTNPDLFKALKGGSSNFGIVTRFDIEAFPQGDLWAGTVLYNQSTATAQVDAFVAFTDAISENPKSSLISTWIFANFSLGARSDTINNLYEYTDLSYEKGNAVKPQLENKTKNIKTNIPKPFKKLLAIPELNANIRLANLTSITDANDLPAARAYFTTLTFRNDRQMLHNITGSLRREVDRLRSKINGTIFFQLQPLPRIITDRGLEKGANVLGLDRESDNLILFLFSIRWRNAEDDDDIAKYLNHFIAVTKETANHHDGLIEFQYLNYASKGQDPISGYGSENVKFLQAVSRRYDPHQTFQKLLHGGFKLPV